jgi:hypothetical protein
MEWNNVMVSSCVRFEINILILLGKLLRIIYNKIDAKYNKFIILETFPALYDNVTVILEKKHTKFCTYHQILCVHKIHKHSHFIVPEKIKVVAMTVTLHF